MFNTDWKRYIEESLQWDLRRPVMINWIYVLIRHIIILERGLRREERDINKQYNANSKKFSLERKLNDEFDSLLRRIYVEDVDKLPVVFYQSGAEQPEAYYRSGLEQAEYYYRSGDVLSNQSTIDYELKVFVPQGLSFIPEQMYAIMQLYRFAGIRPRIFLYDTIGLTPDIAIPATQTQLGYE